MRFLVHEEFIILASFRNYMELSLVEVIVELESGWFILVCVEEN